jgi:hypothetical protein
MNAFASLPSIKHYLADICRKSGLIGTSGGQRPVCLQVEQEIVLMRDKFTSLPVFFSGGLFPLKPSYMFCWLVHS